LADGAPSRRSAWLTARKAILAHGDNDALRRIALFDLVINNADRKGGHLLPIADGHVYAIDHGVTFIPKISCAPCFWGFAGRPLTDTEIADLKRLQADRALADPRLPGFSPSRRRPALHARIDALLAVGSFPSPAGRPPSRPVGHLF